MKAFLNLGCNGRKQAGLTICSGITDRLLDLRRIDNNENLIDYLDRHIRLFDAPAVDVNKVVSTIQHLTQNGAFFKQKEAAIAEFIAVHRRCGVFLYVDPVDPDI